MGAPKSGTTSLYAYLRQHPQVYLPAGGGRQKEPHHFCPDLHSPRYIQDLGEYEKLFDHPQARQATRIGEASVFYLYSEQAPERILAYSPQARIVVMVRDPVDMIHSLHSQRLSSGHEEIEDFAEALAAESARANGERLPRHGHPFEALQYRAMGRYAPHIVRYQRTFGPERVHVILFDDLKSDTPSVYRQLLEFLEVEPDHTPDFRIENPNSRVRSRRLRNFLKFSPLSRALKVPARLAMSRRRRQALAARVNAANEVVAPRPAMEPALRHALVAEFEPHNRQLAEVIGRDLGRWLPTR